MGEVYVAEDTRLGRRVALKVLPEKLAADPERMRRLEREAQALAALNHPNVVTVHSVEEAEGMRFITMELVEGRALAELIPAGGLPIDRFFGLAIRITEGLAAAHGRGIVHRDLKPANVMVSDDGAVKVLDFGLAKLKAGGEGADHTRMPTRTLEELTADGRVVGTFPYMAPEQFQGRPADVRSDIFALGVTLYEMATGKKPFAGSSAVETASAILRDTPAPVTASRPDLPRQLERILRHCLEKDPERRFQSAKDVGNELAALRAELAGTGAAAERAAPTPNRRRLVLAVGMVAALVALAVVAALAVLRGAATGEPIESVAVLPFANVSGDPELEYLGGGLAETLLHRLSKVEELRVAPRALSFRYRGKESDPLVAAEELGVHAIVSGRVQPMADQLVVAVELTDAREVAELWGETYRRPRSDLLALQEELARDIARELRLRLSPEEERQVAVGDTQDPEAFELYLKARHHARAYRTDRESINRAAAYARAAIERDPTYGAAYASLSLSYSILGLWALEPPEEVLPQAREAAARALELDPTLAEAHLAAGAVQWTLGAGWRGAEREFREALELDPDNPQAHALYSYFLTSVGRLPEAVAHARQARGLDPLSAEALSAFAWASYCARRYEDALAAMEALLELDPAANWPRNFRALTLARAGRAEPALAAAESRCHELGRESDRCFHYAVVLAILGRTDEARRIGSRVEPRAVQRATLAAILGDSDEAVAALQEARRAGSPADLLFLLSSPGWEPLWDHPEFRELVRSLGLPEPAAGGG
jgi:TolB-like protein/Tfp pilus assembly protein PilF